MFIGREQELEFLNSKYKSTGGQLIVLYGRRRVGKTETLSSALWKLLQAQPLQFILEIG